MGKKTKKISKRNRLKFKILIFEKIRKLANPIFPYVKKIMN